MTVPQIVVVVQLLAWQRPIYAAVVAAFVAVQFGLMARLLKDPRKYAPWYNATGILLFVFGMLASAFAVRTIVGG